MLGCPKGWENFDIMPKIRQSASHESTLTFQNDYGIFLVASWTFQINVEVLMNKKKAEQN